MIVEIDADGCTVSAVDGPPIPLDILGEDGQRKIVQVAPGESQRIPRIPLPGWGSARALLASPGRAAASAALRRLAHLALVPGLAYAGPGPGSCPPGSTCTIHVPGPSGGKLQAADHLRAGSPGRVRRHRGVD